MNRLRLGLNIDHVATVRNARRGIHPDPLRAARLGETAGADGITVHLREDRRHIRDDDVLDLKQNLSIPLNLEMAPSEEMLGMALDCKPHAVCLVPERRQELTTEGGLDVVSQEDTLALFIQRIKKSDAKVSLFVDPDPVQIEAAYEVGADIVELHTGLYCSAFYHHHEGSEVPSLALDQLKRNAAFAAKKGLEVHAGHGITYDTVVPIAAIAEMAELNIGHFLIGEAMFVGLEQAVKKMRLLMDKARK